MDPGQALAQVLGDAPLVARVEVGEEQADGDRLGAARLDRRRQPLRLVLAERLDDPVGADPLGGLEAQLRARPAAPASARRGGRGRAGPGGRSRAGRRSRGWRSARCARRAPPAGRWSRPSSRGRRPRRRRLRRRPAPAPPRPPRITPTDSSRGRGRHLGGVDGAAVEQDGVGEGPADVDSEEHGVETLAPVALRPSSAAAVAPSGERTTWTPSSSGSVSGKSRAQVAAAGLAPAPGRWSPIAARQRVGVGDQPREVVGVARRPGVAPDRVAGLLGRRVEAPARAARAAAPLAVSSIAAAAARPPKTKHSLSELEASRLAPCRPVQEHSPTA